MTAVVSAALYRDCGRGERKRIAKAFQYAKQASVATNGKLRIPNDLFACGHCHRRMPPSGLCPCVNEARAAAGLPLV